VRERERERDRETEGLQGTAAWQVQRRKGGTAQGCMLLHPPAATLWGEPALGPLPSKELEAAAAGSGS
jgi:hypothetical protein